jgi:hypothetical protein
MFRSPLLARSSGGLDLPNPSATACRQSREICAAEAESPGGEWEMAGTWLGWKSIAEKGQVPGTALSVSRQYAISFRNSAALSRRLRRCQFVNRKGGPMRDGGDGRARAERWCAWCTLRIRRVIFGSALARRFGVRWKTRKGEGPKQSESNNGLTPSDGCLEGPHPPPAIGHRPPAMDHGP